MSFCIVCEQTPISTLSKLDDELKEGKVSVKDLADKYNVETAALASHFKRCVDVPELDGSDLIKQSIKDLTKIIGSFREDIEAGKHLKFNEDDGVDGRGLVSNLITAQRELRENIMAQRRLRSSEEIQASISNNVVGPMIRQASVIAIEEGNRMRDDLFVITKNHPDVQSRIKKTVDAMLLRFAERLKEEATSDLPSKVEAALKSKQEPAPVH